MRWRLIARCVTLSAVLCAVVGPPVIAQGAQAPSAQGPQCSASRLVGTWERISRLRNGLSVQPPDAPLFVKFGSDGYWSMMEMPDRPKVNKPLEQQTDKELWSRFERVEGAYGTWTFKGDVVTRRHLGNIAPGGEGSNQSILHLRGRDSGARRHGRQPLPAGAIPASAVPADEAALAGRHVGEDVIDS